MPVIIVLTIIIICLLFVLRKVRAENKELKQRIAEDLDFFRQVREKDPLTQVMTKEQFMPLVEQEFQRAKRNQQSMSLIACNLDCFEQYRKAYGEMTTDDSLYTIAQAIDGMVKRAGECVARTAWARFWVLLPNIEEEKAIDLAKIIKEKINGLAIPHQDSPIADHVTISMGIVSLMPAEDDELADWIGSVDISVEKAKEEGGDRWHVAK
ncbi:diguanylate cyclase [[Leptolyngbya] sp. PCC 7376]|uniref:diguanylate cyclase domain-containing protein n=1 Tax=[Leptolyngbya] sp. PCC 7376 TaxID=111781 RepID=UPI00029F37E0|nr:diguanylate cyclase [[Leptolyngbya] sp. PCC 7376]AFY39643.1 diguanylate cyclase [[Leptolyngbya] sp. PCC 7376]